MANSLMADVDGSFGFVDAQLNMGFRTTAHCVEENNLENIDDLDTRLQAIASGTYTQAMLRTMNKNDKVYALRVHTNDAAGITAVGKG